MKIGSARALRRAVIVFLCAAMVASLSLLASARVSGVADPDDVSGLMDVKEVEAVGLNRPKFLITTFPKWSAKRIWDRGYGLVHIDARGDDRFEFYVLIYSDGGRMNGVLYRDRRSKPDYAVGQITTWKPSKKSVRIKVPLSQLGVPEDRTAIRWFAKTLMTGSQCPKVCIDRVPDQGSLAHVIVEEPEPSPSPTLPIPTPSSSPSSS